MLQGRRPYIAGQILCPSFCDRIATVAYAAVSCVADTEAEGAGAGRETGRGRSQRAQEVHVDD